MYVTPGLPDLPKEETDEYDVFNQINHDVSYAGALRNAELQLLAN